MVVMHLFMLRAGAAAGAGLDFEFLCGEEELLFQSSIQVLEVSWMRGDFVVKFIPLYVVIALCGLSLPLRPLQSGGVVVIVVVMVTTAAGIAILLAFVMLAVMMYAVAIAVLVQVAFMVIVVIKVARLIHHGFLRVQWGPLTLGRSTVLPHLIDEEDFGHVVYDKHLGPVRDWLSLSTTEMNVHDEDGKRCRGCDHSHGSYIILP